jgi:hypothetical protein
MDLVVGTGSDRLHAVPHTGFVGSSNTTRFAAHPLDRADAAN